MALVVSVLISLTVARAKLSREKRGWRQKLLTLPATVSVSTYSWPLCLPPFYSQWAPATTWGRRSNNLNDDVPSQSLPCWQAFQQLFQIWKGTVEIVFPRFVSRWSATSLLFYFQNHLVRHWGRVKATAEPRAEDSLFCAKIAIPFSNPFHTHTKKKNRENLCTHKKVPAFSITFCSACFIVSSLLNTIWYKHWQAFYCLSSSISWWLSAGLVCSPCHLIQLSQHAPAINWGECQSYH